MMMLGQISPRALDRIARGSCLALVGLLGACTQTQPVAPTVGCDFTPMLAAAERSGPALVPPVPGTMTEVSLNSVSITDLAITNKVLVQNVLVGRTAVGAVEIGVRLVNCTDFPLQVEGRAHFLNEQQQPAEPVSAWKRVFLPARSTDTYREKSTNVDDVRLYYIELREGQ